jgi:branched-chain amino acid transport system ATP-binding protein
MSATAEATARADLSIVELSVARGGKEVLHRVSLDVPPGEVTALLGPNGAGKSSLVLAVAGVLRPTAGRILLAGKELGRRAPEKIRAAGVAVVPEGRRLLPDLTVEDNLRVATYSLSRADAKSGVAHALELFPELEKRWKIQARSLSGGEQQMVVLAQAIVSRPSVMLVDELSLGLAPVVVKRLVPTLESIAASGVGVLLIEQFAHVALGLAQTAYLIEGGRIRYHGTAKELQENPDLLHSAYLLTDELVDEVVEHAGEQGGDHPAPEA